MQIHMHVLAAAELAYWLCLYNPNLNTLTSTFQSIKKNQWIPAISKFSGGSVMSVKPST